MKGRKTTRGSNKKLLYSVVLVTLILLTALITYYLFFQPYIEDWTAAIVDQLAVEAALTNQSISFNATSTSILAAAGFDIKYYPSKDITVNFYKELPSKGSKILLLRVHSAVRDKSDFVDLFTSENYTTQKATEYSAKYGNQISHAEFLVFPYNEYFAIGPTFVNSSMKGRFDSNCVIVLMGCNSLNTTSMAKALVGRGAKVVIGWTGWVEANYTDTFTIKLLQLLLAENPETIKGAVDKINYQISHSDPNPFNAKLAYYPTLKEVSNFIIPTKKNKVSSPLLSEAFQPWLSTILTKWKQDSIA
jgi:hypothetical protein